MRRQLLRAKVHHATVTEVDVEYEGSLGLDAELMEAARIVPFERVEVYNTTNGNRFATYAIPLETGSRRISVYGAAAHLANPGDRIIIACYADVEERELGLHRPIVLQMREGNRIGSPRREATGGGTH